MKYFKLAPFKQLSYIIPLVIGLALILSWVALFNGFPLVFSDTGIYLLAAIQGIVSWSHPIFYSYFVFPLHSLFSLWAIVFFCSSFFLYLLYIILKVTFKIFHFSYFILIAIILSLISSLPWQTAMLLPDFYAPFIILLIFLLGNCENQLTLFENIFCFTSLFLITSFHYSYLPLAFGVATVSLIFFLLREIKNTPIKKKKKAVKNKIYSKATKKILLLFSPIIIAMSMHIVLQLSHKNRFTVAPNSHAFLMAKFLSTGTIQKYLAKNCQIKKYKICLYQTELSGDYLWSSNSPLHKIGIEQSRKENMQIIKETLLSYPWINFKSALRSTWQQLVFFKLEHQSILLKHWTIHRVIRGLFPNNYKAYTNSRQQTDRLNKIISIFNKIHTPIIYLSLIISCIFAIIAFKKQHNTLVILFMLIIAGLVLNAVITGTLSGLDSRYQNRMIWLIPFYALIAGTYLFDCWWKQNHLNKK